MDLSLSSRSAKLLSFLILGLIGAGASLAVWADWKAQSIEGPSLIRQDSDGKIWTVYKGDLFQFSPEGDRRRFIHLADLGINDMIADFLPDSSGDLVFGIMPTQEIRRYSAEGKLKISFATKQIESDRDHGAFKFALDPEMGDYYVADTIEHRILIFDPEGHSKGGFGQKGNGEGQLHFPNQITFGPDGLLYIADTNNHRIMVREKTGKPIDSIKTVETDRSCPFRWPTDFAIGPKNQLTVINKTGSLEGGEMAFVRRDPDAVQRISLPPGTDPSGIVIRPDDVLIPDREGMRILRLSYDGTVLGRFGDTDFIKTLSEARTEREHLRLWVRSSYYGLFTLLFFLLIGLTVQRWLGLKKSGGPDTTPAWLDIRPPSYQKISPGRKRLYYAAIIVTYSVPIVLLFYFLFRSRSDDGLPATVLLAGLVSAIFLLMICLLILMKGLKDGLLRERQFKNVEKIFRRYIPVLNQIFMPEEKVRFYMLARRLPDAMEAVLTHGVMSIHMGLLVITTQRALFLATDLFAHQLRQIHEASLSEIRETRKDPPKKLFGRFGNPAGAGTLTLYFTADSPPIRFQFFWSRLVEEAMAASRRADRIRDPLSRAFGKSV